MAIVINGSGTITGLSAGGLPDGSVTADDLASTLDLSGKTVTLAAGGTGYGKVLQVVEYTSTTETTITSASFVDYLSGAITPSSTSSKIAVFCYTNGYAESANILQMTVFRGIASSGTNLGTGANNMLGQHGGGADMRFLSSIQLIDSPSTTSSQTYSFAVRRNGSGVVVTSNNDTRSSLILMEIAG